MDDCPNCGRPNEAFQYMGAGNPAPVEGNVSICWGCKEPSIFTDDQGHLRKATDDERRDILSDPDVKAALYAVAESTRPQEAKTMFEEISGGTD